MMADDSAEESQSQSDLEATLELLEEATYAACMKMKVKDLKAELELRKVNTAGRRKSSPDCWLMPGHLGRLIQR